MKFPRILISCVVATSLASCKDSTTTGPIDNGSGKFSGGLGVADISGLLHPLQPVAGATLTFLDNSVTKGTATSGVDGNWTSPVLAGGTTYIIHVTAPGKKDFPITVPLVPTPRDIGVFGMVSGSTTPPQTTLHLTLLGGGSLLAPVGSSSPTASPSAIGSTVEIYDGVFLATSDLAAAKQTASFSSLPAALDFDGAAGHLPKLTVWGPVTVRVVIPGVAVPDQVVYFDTPTATVNLQVITLAPNAVASIDVAPAASVGNTGSTVQLVATPRDANRKALTGRTIAWTSDNLAGATVSASGLVTLTGFTAPVTITATSEGISSTAQVVAARPAVIRTTASVVSSNVNQYYYIDAGTQAQFVSAQFSGSSGTTIKIYAAFPVGTPLCSVTVITSLATCSVQGPVSGRYVVVIGPTSGGSLFANNNSD